MSTYNLCYEVARQMVNVCILCYNHYKKVTNVMVFGDEMLATGVYLFSKYLFTLSPALSDQGLFWNAVRRYEGIGFQLG